MIEEPEDVDAAERARRDREEQGRLAWGSWRQDRALNRRKVLRSLVGLLVAVVLTGLLAYGCSLVRGPRHVRLNPVVSGLTLQPSTPDTQQLQGRFEAAGATGPAAGYYRGPNGDVLFVAGYSTELPPDVLSSLLPPVTGSDLEYEGRGGPLNCGATANGSRCVWKSSDMVGGTAATGVAPNVLEQVTRDLRGGAIRP